MRTNISIPSSEIAIHTKQGVSIFRPTKSLQFHVHERPRWSSFSMLRAVFELMLKREKCRVSNAAAFASVPISHQQFSAKFSTVFPSPSRPDFLILLTVPMLQVVSLLCKPYFLWILFGVKFGPSFVAGFIRKIVLGVVNPQTIFTRPKSAVSLIPFLRVKTIERLFFVAGRTAFSLAHG